jgi:hypothetical protein
MRRNADAGLPVIKDADSGLTFSGIPASTYNDFSTPSLRTLKMMPRNLNEIVRS